MFIKQMLKDFWEQNVVGYYDLHANPDLRLNPLINDLCTYGSYEESDVKKALYLLDFEPLYYNHDVGQKSYVETREKIKEIIDNGDTGHFRNNKSIDHFTFHA